MQQFINKVWYQNHWLNYALRPYAWIYQGVSCWRRRAYQKQIYSSKKFPVPIIVVGNITVGGTGKTPLVIAVVNWLVAQGYRPGVVSRGYKGKADSWPQMVKANADPAMVGDEPVIVARRTGVPVVVDPKRVRAVEYLLQQCDVDIIVSDDGLQHYAMQRDIEIAVIDGQRRLGNGYCLPAGPLREPVNRLRDVDFVVVNGAAESNEWSMRYTPKYIYNVANPELTMSSDDAKCYPWHAVAGIGHPERFFTQLRQSGLTIMPHAYPDHHPYQPSDIQFGADQRVLMTEKDAIKCRSFADQRHWCLAIDADCAPAFFSALQAKIQAVT